MTAPLRIELIGLRIGPGFTFRAPWPQPRPLAINGHAYHRRTRNRRRSRP